ncbi:MAG TPA: lysophospholipid acyltransferase family protein [Polyangiaceae bacterium]|nr:lysophospholipid acyltransferase family protein [Polyangiaceae bacterium]
MNLVRALLVALCGWVLNLYFRRIEITGLERVPQTGPVLFILNHPNGLLDPVFVLCLSGRRVSFLAKEPLFRMPIVGTFVRAFECLPVYRSQDGKDPANNRKMIESAVRLLQSGNAIAIFPEGTSHSDPDLRPFRSGAARIALSASSVELGADAPEVSRVRIVPCGLYYSEKTRFRSSALVSFGEPLVVPKVPLDERLEPSVEAARALTAELEHELRKVTVHADSVEALGLAQRAERLLRGAASDESGDTEAHSRPNVEARRDLRQRLIDGYQALRQTHPAELDRVIAELEAFETFLDKQGLRSEQRVVFQRAELLARALVGGIVGLFLLPLACVGLVCNFATYRFVSWASLRYAKSEEDVITTGKVLGGLLLYPLTWLIESGAVWASFGWQAGLVAVLVSPLAALATLAFIERATRDLTRTLVVAKLLLRPDLKRAIIARRQRVRGSILSLAELVSSQPPGT